MLVEELNLIAAPDRTRIVRVNEHRWLFSFLLHGSLQSTKRAVEESVRGRGQETKGIQVRILVEGVPAVVDHGGQPLLLQRFRGELELSRGGLEPLREPAHAPWDVEPHGFAAQDPLDVDPLEVGMVGGLKDFTHQVLNGPVKPPIAPAQRLADALNHLKVRAALAGRRDDAPRVLEMEMAVALVKIARLDERHGRKDDVRVPGRVGKEAIVNHRKKIFPPEALEDQVLKRRRCRGVRSVNVKKIKGRVAPPRERIPQVGHVQDAGRTLQPIGALDRAQIGLELAPGVVLNASAELLIGSESACQATNRPHAGGAVRVASKANPDLEDRRLGGGEAVREDLKLLEGHPGDFRRPFGRILREDLVAKALIPDRAAGNEASIHEAIALEDMHQAERQRRVRARLHLNPAVGHGHGTISIGIDSDQLRALLPCFLDERHQVDLRRDHVAAPNHDQVRVDNVFWIDPKSIPHHGVVAGIGAVIANVLTKGGRSQAVEERFTTIALHAPHGAGVVVLKNGLAAVARLNFLDTLRRHAEGLIPRDRGEAGSSPSARSSRSGRLPSCLFGGEDRASDGANRPRPRSGSPSRKGSPG